MARPSRYGNPFRIVATSVAGLAWHDLLEWDCGIGAIPTEETCYASLSNRYDAAEHAVGLYRRLLLERQHVWTPARFEKWIRDARSHDLACYCPPQQPCHAEPLLELANSIHSNADTGAKP